MNSWVAIDVDMKSNPKVWALAKNVRGLSGDGPRTHIAIAMGHLVELFGAVAKLRPDGRVNDISDELLEEWAGWGGEHGRFAAAFRDSFVIDGVIKGWDERNGKLLAHRERERERKAQDRARTVRRTVQGQGADNGGTVQGKSAPTVPDLTRHIKQEPRAPAREGPPLSQSNSTATATDEPPPRAPSGSMVKRGELAYDKLASKARSYGLITEIPGTDYELLDVRERAGFKAVGGWRGLREVQQDQETWDRKRFAEAYAAAPAPSVAETATR